MSAKQRWHWQRKTPRDIMRKKPRGKTHPQPGSTGDYKAFLFYYCTCTLESSKAKCVEKTSSMHIRVTPASIRPITLSYSSEVIGFSKIATRAQTVFFGKRANVHSHVWERDYPTPVIWIFTSSAPTITSFVQCTIQVLTCLLKWKILSLKEYSKYALLT